MKHFRMLLPFLILALVLSGCGSTSQEPYNYTFATLTGTVNLMINPEACTIMNGTDVYHYTLEDSGNRTSYVITYPNGATYHWTKTGNISSGGWSDDYDESRYISGNILIDAIEQNAPREKTGSPILGIPLMALGAWNVLSPETVFYFRKGWMFRDAEPSDAYLVMTRIGGVITALAGLVLCFI